MFVIDHVDYINSVLCSVSAVSLKAEKITKYKLVWIVLTLTLKRNKMLCKNMNRLTVLVIQNANELGQTCVLYVRALETICELFVNFNIT